MTETELKYFWERVEAEPNSGCWHWVGTRAFTGYSGPYAQWNLRATHGSRRVHCIAYEHFVGPIQPGLELDHLCRVTYCVNPAHLEAVTHHENMRRAHFQASQRTACPRGHHYDMVTNGGRSRWCRRCHNFAMRQYRERVKARAAS